MIYIGCDTWSNHPIFTKHPNNHRYKNKSYLVDYAKHFNCVEGDFPFYYIPTVKALKNWSNKTPDSFKFILKANRRITLQDYKEPISLKGRLGTAIAFDKNLQYLLKQHKLMSVLLQFSRYFYNTPANRAYIRELRQKMYDLPLSIEFRNNSWYQNSTTRVLVGSFLHSLKIANVIVDEPHTNSFGAPFLQIVTNPNYVLIRLQGRNKQGWLYHSRGKDWRKKRNLYCYSKDELQWLAKKIKELQESTKNVVVIFNNNSGFDAAPNALELKRILASEK